MSILIADCPKCGSSQMTHDLKAYVLIDIDFDFDSIYDAFCQCRKCEQTNVFVIACKSPGYHAYADNNNLLKKEIIINSFFDVKYNYLIHGKGPVDPPQYTPEKIKSVFQEGAACLKIDCCNAAATMFRLCVDLATRELLPLENTAGLNNKVRRDLGLRLPWLLKNNLLDSKLKDLSLCIKEDGNDGAHVGNLSKLDAEEVMEFTITLLQVLYTVPMRLKHAKERRINRRGEN